jgi:hypothetical protein
LLASFSPTPTAAQDFAQPGWRNGKAFSPALSAINLQGQEGVEDSHVPFLFYQFLVSIILCTDFWGYPVLKCDIV